MNASASWFTSYERSLLKTDYGTQSYRLSRDHSKPIDSCNLCLRRARDPVCCASHGDIFCRECAVSNLLAQRVEIKRLQKEVEKRLVEEDEDRLALEKQAVDRGVKEFEQVQMGLENAGNNKKRKSAAVTETATTATEGEPAKKREKTFTLDEDELLRIARSDRQRLKDAITSEASHAAIAKLPSFWIPSLTPSAAAPKKIPKLQSVCPASDPNNHHYYNLKTLVSVHFEEEADEKNRHGEAVRICPSCRKALSNEVKATVAKPCGHILCAPCAKKFVLDPEHAHEKKSIRRCFVCAADLTTLPEKKREKDGKKEKSGDAVKPGIVQISSDGTGFTAGGGMVMAKKNGIAFQC